MALQMRTPWVGNGFDGLLVLGESHYASDDAEDVELTRFVVNLVVRREYRHAFFTKIEKVVTGQAHHVSGTGSFWHQIAFANFCPGYVDGPRIPPTKEMWGAGYAQLEALLKMVRPTRLLILGDAVWRHMPELSGTIELSTAGKQRQAGFLSVDDLPPLPTTSIKHPASYGFRTMDWHAYYQDFVAAMPVATD